MSKTLEGFEATRWMGVFATGTTVDHLAARMQSEIAFVAAMPDVKAKLLSLGIEPVGSTPQQYSDLIRSEVQRWHKLIREQKISLD